MNSREKRSNNNSNGTISRKRKRLSHEEKAEVIEMADKHQWSTRMLAMKFGVGKTQIGHILRDVRKTSPEVNSPINNFSDIQFPSKGISADKENSSLSVTSAQRDSGPKDNRVSLSYPISRTRSQNLGEEKDISVIKRKFSLLIPLENEANIFHKREMMKTEDEPIPVCVKELESILNEKSRLLQNRELTNNNNNSTNSFIIPLRLVDTTRSSKEDAADKQQPTIKIEKENVYTEEAALPHVEESSIATSIGSYNQAYEHLKDLENFFLLSGDFISAESIFKVMCHIENDCE